MSVDASALLSKIKTLYPDIEKHGIEMAARFDEASNAWMVSMKKGDDTMETHIENQDAEDCVNGSECVYLSTQIARFVEAYCLRGDSCDT
jgi:hypothetical protein